ncbi:MAG: DHHA1 domain-containing protein [bacterium]|nr:DHHA1 domain-containing protein [bacterium]
MAVRYAVRERAHEDLLQDLLHARGVVGEPATAEFLQPDFERDSHDPFLLPDMAVAVERILFAIKNGELIAVWSDYDCDGVPGGVLLCEFLQSIGASVVHYIPDRHIDGFGLNIAGIAELAERGARLIITVDCGTTDVAQATFAREKKIDLIITDHHLPLVSENSFSPAAGRRGDASENNFSSTQNLPPAVAVVNPHRTDSIYPFTELCGAGVAWKLVQAILSKNRPEHFGEGQPFDYAQGKEKWLLDLVGIATLADMVPLVGENRMLASYGLRVLRRTRREGLCALLKLLRINQATLAEEDVTFMVAPRINAASRLEKAETAARFLSSTLSSEEGGESALKLNRINDERKGLVAAAMKHAHKQLRAREGVEDIIVIGSVDWRPGILGLIAQKLVEQEGKTVFVWGRGAGSSIKGSCRSGDGSNIVEIMRGAADLFDDFGGHDFAGGFSLGEDKVHQLYARLASSHAALVHTPAGEKETIVDRELELADAFSVHQEIQKLAPFGVGNAKPLFLFPNVSIGRARTFGKGDDHLELLLKKDNAQVAGVSFFKTPDSFQKTAREGTRADVVGHLELDWRGSPRLRIVDVL